MTIYVPEGFILQDPKPAPEYLGPDLKPITDSQFIKQITQDDPIILLEIETSDKKSAMSIALIPITEKLTQFFGDSIQYIETSKEIVIAGARQATEKFDTLFSKVKISDINFDKMFSIIKIRGKDFYSGGYSAKIGNYYLAISMYFDNKKFGDKLMRIIETAKFN